MLPTVSFTDSEIRSKLIEFGYPVGPVTDTTRNILLKKLENLMRTDEPRKAAGSNVEDYSSVTNELSDKEEMQILFFDIETSDLEMDCDVLQIAVKSGPFVFNGYIKPTKTIPWDVYLINYLSNRGGELYFKEQLLPAQSVRTTLEDLLRFLKMFEKRCILVAHNCSFDASRLMRIIKQESMEKQFACVIAGFTDTLAMFRAKFPERRGKGSCTLKTLATETLSLSTDGAHDANNDVIMLEKLALYHFTVQQLIANRTTFASVLTKGISYRSNRYR